MLYYTKAQYQSNIIGYNTACDRAYYQGVLYYDYESIIYILSTNDEVNNVNHDYNIRKK